jgi:hypothetical protein
MQHSIENFFEEEEVVQAERLAHKLDWILGDVHEKDVLVTVLGVYRALRGRIKKFNEAVSRYNSDLESSNANYSEIEDRREQLNGQRREMWEMFNAGQRVVLEKFDLLPKEMLDKFMPEIEEYYSTTKVLARYMLQEAGSSLHKIPSEDYERQRALNMKRNNKTNMTHDVRDWYDPDDSSRDAE